MKKVKKNFRKIVISFIIIAEHGRTTYSHGRLGIGVHPALRSEDLRVEGKPQYRRKKIHPEGYSRPINEKEIVEGVFIAKELLEETNEIICRVYLVPSFGKVELALEVVEDISF